MSYRRRFNLDEVLREWAAEQVATSRDPRRGGEEMAAATEGGPDEDEVRHIKTWELRVTLNAARSHGPMKLKLQSLLPHPNTTPHPKPTTPHPNPNPPTTTHPHPHPTPLPLSL